MYVYSLNTQDVPASGEWGDKQGYSWSKLKAGDLQFAATRERVVKQFSKKSIEQLAVITELNSLVSLSGKSDLKLVWSWDPLKLIRRRSQTDGTIYLHDLHTLEKQTTFGTSSQTKGQAGIFAIDTSIQQTGSQLAPSTPKGKEREKTQANAKARSKGKDAASTTVGEETVPIVVTTLAVGCRRRLVLFTWRDSQWQDPKAG